MITEDEIGCYGRVVGGGTCGPIDAGLGTVPGSGSPNCSSPHSYLDHFSINVNVTQ